MDELIPEVLRDLCHTEGTFGDNACILISPSKHFFFKINGEVSYQKRPLHPKDGKTRLFWYLIQNGYNGWIHVEIHPELNSLVAIKFLQFAFHNTNGIPYGDTELNFQIHGTPKNLKISKKLLADNKELERYLSHSFRVLHPKNGFDLGSTPSMIKTLEGELQHGLFLSRYYNRTLTEKNPDELLFIGLLMSEKINSGRLNWNKFPFSL